MSQEIQATPETPSLPRQTADQFTQAWAALARIQDNGWATPEQIEDWRSKLTGIQPEIQDQLDRLERTFEAVFDLFDSSSPVWRPSSWAREHAGEAEWPFYDRLRREQENLDTPRSENLIGACRSIQNHLASMHRGSDATPEQQEELRLTMATLVEHMQECQAVLGRWKSLRDEIEQEASLHENAEVREAARKYLGLD